MLAFICHPGFFKVRTLLTCGMLCAVVAAAGDAIAAEISTGESTPSVAPPASWVRPQFFDRQAVATGLEANADQHWLLNERQINAAENETFFHVVRRMRTVSGVQSGANLAFDFSPAYQSLTLHWVRIWRGADYLNRLDTNRFKLVRRERDLDEFLLNGEQSAVLVMDDVRVGDIVDYSYSIKGANPIFAGRFSASVPVQTEQPVERLLTRVLWPGQRRLYAKAHGCSVRPAAVTGKETIEYTWDLKQVPGFRVEDMLPQWCNPQPWVQLSEFRTWAEVNQWALALFQTASPLSPGLSKKIAEWKWIASREQQVLAVLRFVQDEVRYFGIEIGESSQKPADPSVVFSRRFGDCKDKALLFVTILRALGVEAHPVLVNTGFRHILGELQPCADAFDHAIAVAQFDGQTCWLDPTASYQRGSLGAHYLPNYEYGLVISPKTTGLTVIPHTTGLPQTTTMEYFQLGGKTGPSTLKVVTVAEGRDAENLRALLATSKRSDIEKDCLRFYSTMYPGIKRPSPMVFEDDERQNKIQTTAFYAIDNAWIPSDKEGGCRCEFYPSAIAALLKKPADAERKLPLGLNFPQHHILRTEVMLPDVWPVDAENRTVSDAAFFFRKDCRCFGNRLVMEYEYRSLADSVPPERTVECIQRLKQASQLPGYALSWR